LTFPLEPWAGQRRSENIVASQLTCGVYGRIHAAPASNKIWEEDGWKYETKYLIIDHTTLRQAATTLPPGKLTCVMKHWFDMCGLSNFMKSWRSYGTAKCPRCCHVDETACHVNRCPRLGAKEQWDKSLQGLGAWLAKHHSHPALTSLIIAQLTEWKHHTPHSTMDDQALIHPIDMDQDSIGWEDLLNGKISTLGQEIQCHYVAS
jgi:hypothetical protein